MAKSEKFISTCKKCGSKNVSVDTDATGNKTGEDEYSEWVELNCKDCGESENIL
jgi:predicted nucleic-acid-binding Zn-ribbon protein